MSWKHFETTHRHLYVHKSQSKLDLWFILRWNRSGVNFLLRNDLCPTTFFVRFGLWRGHGDIFMSYDPCLLEGMKGHNILRSTWPPTWPICTLTTWRQGKSKSSNRFSHWSLDMFQVHYDLYRKRKMQKGIFRLIDSSQKIGMILKIRWLPKQLRPVIVSLCIFQECRYVIVYAKTKRKQQLEKHC